MVTGTVAPVAYPVSDAESWVIKDMRLPLDALAAADVYASAVDVLFAQPVWPVSHCLVVLDQAMFV
jgi:hypothetical protein